MPLFSFDVVCVGSLVIMPVLFFFKLTNKKVEFLTRVGTGRSKKVLEQA